MSRKRQTPIFDPHGMPSHQLTTLSYDFDSGHEVAEHYHKEGQVLFASQGVMTIRTKAEIWVAPPLRAVWIPPDEVHSIVMSGTVKMRTLYFVQKLAKSAPRKCCVLNVSPFFRELILHACSKPAWKIRIVKERRVIEILLDQLRSSTAIPLQLRYPKDARASRVVEILIKDPSDSRTLESLCHSAGGSQRTIERAFLKETGLTFGKWRQQLRVVHGLRLLASGEKVTTAALESGYSSPSAFISVFKKALGKTPNQYLQMQG